MSAPDRNRIDRTPTKVERWVGIVLAAVASAAFLALLLLGLVMLGARAQGDTYSFWFVGVTGLMAAGCVFLFYRLVFTKPRAASARVNRSVWTALAGMATVAFLVSLIWPAPRPTAPMFGMLATVAISRATLAWSVSRASKNRDGRRGAV